MSEQCVFDVQNTLARLMHLVLEIVLHRYCIYIVNMY
jgi:hypothetical protein